MIQKIEAPTSFYESIHGVSEEWNLVWWVGIVGFLSPRPRFELEKQIEKKLTSYWKRIGDADATFPYELHGGHTKESRYCLELIGEVNDLLKKYDNFYNPKAYEVFFLKLDPASGLPRYLLSSLPVFLVGKDLEETSKTQMGRFSKSSFGSQQFQVTENFFDQLSLPSSVELKVASPFDERETHLFSWTTESTPVSVEPEEEMGDAGFAMDFDPEGTGDDQSEAG